MKLYFDLRKNIITQKFGQNLLPIYKQYNMKGHNGIDFKYQSSEKIGSPCDLLMEIIKNEIDNSGGIGTDGLVKLSEPMLLTTDIGGVDKPVTVKYFKLRFWHLESWNRKVKDKVETGDKFAIADNTGISTGDHLHFGLKPVVYKNGKWVNMLQNNGYYGAIDPISFVVNISPNLLMEILKKQQAIIKEIIRQIKEFFKGREMVTN